ncbi:MAG: hypothetical protein R3E93_15465 [Thiothrix sp.]
MNSARINVIEVFLLKDPYWNVVCEFAGEILVDFSTVSHEA